jgi:hypothetical protein
MLMRYDWPGNVRELQNCITRAVVMAEGPLIQADDIHLDTEDGDGDRAEAFLEAAAALPVGAPPGLNARQRTAWAAIAAQGRSRAATRRDRGTCPPAPPSTTCRTALGFLKDRCGPHYVVARARESQLKRASYRLQQAALKVRGPEDSGG